MTAVMFVVGVLVVALGIILSIALHEIGHLVPAKLFGVRVTQYMVGFGKTLWSKKKGETEYGIKAIPLGGYVSMIGMYPPNHPEQGDNPRNASTGLVQQMAHDAREIASEELQEGDEKRTFISLPVWKRIIIMLGGPFMNLVIAVVLTAILITSFGTATATTKISEVYQCAVSSEEQQNRADDGAEECHESDPAGPAYDAGLLPGDEIIEFNGQEVSTWNDLTDGIQQRAGQETDLVYVRDGEQHSTQITPELTERPITDGSGRVETEADGTPKTHEVGFVGMGSEVENVPQPVTETGPVIWGQITGTAEVILKMPVKIWDTAVVVVTDGERDPNGPMSVVGVGRIAGESAAMDEVPIADRGAFLLSLVAGVNVALMAFNLLPLLPLDGGHVAGALWESIRRGWAKLRRRQDPGVFDIAKLLPLTYVVAGCLLVMTVIFIVADLVKPIQFF